MLDLMQSEIGVQIVAFISVVLLAVLTYVFGFKSNNSTEADDKQSASTRQSVTRQSINGSSKSKKQQKSLDTPQTHSVPSTPKQQQVKKSELKSQKQVVNKKSEVKQQEKKIEQEVPLNNNNNEEESTGEWITVKDKKQKKNQTEEKPIAIQQPAKVKGDKTKVTQPKKTETAITEALTIKEKKPKKDSISKVVLPEPISEQEQPIAQPTSKVVEEPKPLPKVVSASAEPVPSPPLVQPKKSKSKSAKPIEQAIAQPEVPTLPTPAQPVQAKLDLLTSSLNELSTDKNNESDWIQANSKAIKTKLKRQSVPVVAAAAEPVPIKNKSKPTNKTANKQLIAEKPVEIPGVLVAAATVTSKPIQETNLTVPKSLELVEKQSTPDAIAAAIIESKMIQLPLKAQLTNESITTNNNNNSSSNNNNNNKIKKPTVNMSQLKQTNLSDSMILIDSNASSNLDENFNQVSLSGKNSSRTDSNQSSSESLQDLDVDGDDGWATITSKKTTKRTTVRREQ